MFFTYAFPLCAVRTEKLQYVQHKMMKTLRKQGVTSTGSTMHGIRAIKLRIFDDSTLFNKSNSYNSRMSSLFNFYPFQHVRYIKPSEVAKEFHYISGHVIALLSYCNPKLLMKWCENLMASKKHKIKILSSTNMDELRQLKTSLDILTQLNTYWSWSNHSILTCFAKFSEVAKTLLEEFDSRLCVRKSVMEYPILLPTDNTYTVLTMKLKRKLRLSLEIVYDVQSIIIEKCEITEHALKLSAVHKSPLLQIQWVISENIVKVVDANIKKHHNYFATNGITVSLIPPNMKQCIDSDLKPTPKKYVLQLGNTLLQATLKKGNHKVAELLIKRGANVRIIDKLGCTPLHVASEHGYDKVVEALIEAGAAVNMANNLGYTPLHVAAERGHAKVVKALINADADINFTNQLGQTPVDVAKRNVVYILKPRTSYITQSGDTPLKATLKRGYHRIAELLIKAGANVRIIDKQGNTLLHVASERGYDKAVKVLIRGGIDVDITNENLGCTPLHVASEHGHDKVVEALIREGAAVNMANNLGCTPLHVASEHGHDKVVKALIEAEADINITNQLGQTPVDVAKRNVVNILKHRTSSTAVSEEHDPKLDEPLSPASRSTDQSVATLEDLDVSVKPDSSDTQYPMRILTVEDPSGTTEAHYNEASNNCFNCTIT